MYGIQGIKPRAAVHQAHRGVRPCSTAPYDQLCGGGRYSAGSRLRGAVQPGFPRSMPPPLAGRRATPPGVRPTGKHWRMPAGRSSACWPLHLRQGCAWCCQRLKRRLQRHLWQQCQVTQPPGRKPMRSSAPRWAVTRTACCTGDLVMQTAVTVVNLIHDTATETDRPLVLGVRRVQLAGMPLHLRLPVPPRTWSDSTSASRPAWCTMGPLSALRPVGGAVCGGR